MGYLPVLLSLWFVRSKSRLGPLALSESQVVSTKKCLADMLVVVEVEVEGFSALKSERSEPGTRFRR